MDTASFRQGIQRQNDIKITRFIHKEKSNTINNYG